MTQDILLKDGQVLLTNGGALQRPTPSIFTNTYSMGFDGVDDRVDIATPTDFDFEKTDPITISAWIKPNDVTGGDEVIGKYTNAGGWPINQGWRMAVLDTAGADRFVYVIGDGSNGIYKYSNPISTGSWNHITITSPGVSNLTEFDNNVKLYINGTATTGTRVGTTFPTGSIINANPVKFGYQASGFFEGNIDEPSIYGAELTPTQIQDIFNNGNPRDLSELDSYSNCIGWWRMGDDALDADTPEESNIIKDQVNYPNGNDGSPANSPWTPDPDEDPVFQADVPVDVGS